jgi:hypothetical protein
MFSRCGRNFPPEFERIISMDDWDNFPDVQNILTATNDQQKQIASKFFSSDENASRLLNIVDFFDTLSACIEHHACDRNSAIYLFQRAASQIFEVAGYHIEDTRQTDSDPNFARGLESVYRLKPECFIMSYV